MDLEESQQFHKNRKTCSIYSWFQTLTFHYLSYCGIGTVIGRESVKHNNAKQLIFSLWYTGCLVYSVESTHMRKCRCQNIIMENKYEGKMLIHCLIQNFIWVPLANLSDIFKGMLQLSLCTSLVHSCISWGGLV